LFSSTSFEQLITENSSVNVSSWYKVYLVILSNFDGLYDAMFPFHY